MGLREVLEAPDLAIVGGEVLEGVPVAILDALYSTVLDEPFACLLVEWRVDFVREIHIFPCSGLELRKLLVLLRDLSGILHEALVDVELFIIVTVVFLERPLGALLFVLSAHDLDLHVVEHGLEGLLVVLLGRQVGDLEIGCRVGSLR